jgi:hypothetical protein
MVTYPLGGGVAESFKRFLFSASIHHSGTPRHNSFAVVHLACFLLKKLTKKNIIIKKEGIMKTKKNRKKLALNKISIANLDKNRIPGAKDALPLIKGGDNPNTAYCPTQIPPWCIIIVT